MESLEALVADIEQQGRGVIMTMGKGGVGKTTVAAAIAVMLARRGHPVHLSTTDPAAHLAQTLDGHVAGLTVSRIDPARETAAYQAEVLKEQGAALDAAGRALMEEDLRSPCTEEIAVFRAFAREVGLGADRFVVLDTAPTGHTLLLLDASEAYNRELQRQSRSSQPDRFSGCWSGCAIRRSPASCWSLFPKPPPCMKRRTFSRICDGRTSSLSPGSSTRACSTAVPATRCSSAANRRSTVTCSRSRSNTPPAPPGSPGSRGTHRPRCPRPAGGVPTPTHPPMKRSSVAAGVSPAVEGDVSPPGIPG
jgi:hypothetical protein